MSTQLKVTARRNRVSRTRIANLRASAGEALHSDPIRLLIVDDHAVVREGLTAIINRKDDMCVVAEAANGRNAIEMWQQHRPDVTLLDLRMPDLNGLDVVKALRNTAPSVHIILLTTYDTDENVYQAFKAGVKAYLLKDTPSEALLECVRRVHAGEIFVPGELAAKMARRIGDASLSVREGDVLSLLALGKSNREISTALYISETTVKSHVKSLFAKLHAISRTEAVSIALKRGIIRL